MAKTLSRVLKTRCFAHFLRQISHACLILTCGRGLSETMTLIISDGKAYLSLEVALHNLVVGFIPLSIANSSVAGGLES